MKLPAFQFYPADWRKDPGVQALSYHDRGVWFEILCLMHESEQRGKLTLNGNPMPEDALARLLGLDKQNLTKVISTLLEYGVASRDISGCLINRRMVKDEQIRQIRADAGQKGGQQRIDNEKLDDLLKQNSSKNLKQGKQNSTPSSTIFSSERKEDVVEEKSSEPFRYAVGDYRFNSMPDYLGKRFSLLVESFQRNYDEIVLKAFLSDFSKRNIQKNWKNEDDLRKHLNDALRKFNDLNGSDLRKASAAAAIVHQDVNTLLRPISTLNGKH